MTESAAVQLARAAFFRHFAWAEGHADVWAIFADAAAFAAVVNGLAAPWRNVGITHIVGVEARGFLLGGAVAAELGAGFVAVRKPGGLLPGPKARVVASTDYRGIAHQLRVQRVLRPQDVALLVDDWAERGSQAAAVRQLVVGCQATFAGASLLVDQMDDSARARLGRVTSLVRACQLGRSGSAGTG